MDVKSGWKAAAAAIPITPAEPMWLAGWAARRSPATGKAMELFAKALALEDSTGARLVIVTADLIAIPRGLATAIAARVQRRWSLPRESILFNASHTHNGPEVRPDKVPFFEIPSEFAAKIEPYVAQLEEKMAALIDAVLLQLERASLRVSRARTGFAENRRSPQGTTDHDVPLLSVTDRGGKTLAILFGYACHNLTLPPAFCAYHGDYAGVAQAQLEKEFPGATALFLSGAGADQDPRPRGDSQAVERHGTVLAEAVGDALSQEAKEDAVIHGPLRVAWEEVSLDLLPLPPAEILETDRRSDDLPRRRKAEYLLAAQSANRPLATTLTCPVQVVRFGEELLLIALGGEPVADFALRFKAEFAGPLVWVAGYSNDMFGYLPTQRVQREGGYEGGRAALWSALPAALAESAEERVVAAVRRLVGRTR